MLFYFYFYLIICFLLINNYAILEFHLRIIYIVITFSNRFISIQYNSLFICFKLVIFTKMSYIKVYIDHIQNFPHKQIFLRKLICFIQVVVS